MELLDQMVDLEVFLLYHFQQVSTLLRPLVCILLDFLSSRLILYSALQRLRFFLHGLFDVDFDGVFLIFVIHYFWLLFIFCEFFVFYGQLQNILLFLLQSELQFEYLCLVCRDFLLPLRQCFPISHEFIIQFAYLFLLLRIDLPVER